MQQLRMFGCTFVDSTQLPEQIVKQLSELQPDVINGLGGPIYLAAKSLNRGACRAIRPKFLALGGDTLTPSMIRVIEEVFQAPVFIFYGSHEFNLIASQCPLGGELHVLDDSVLLEVLDDGKRAGPGKSGQVVATALHSFSQPFIRYKLGDIATRGRDECSCGSPCSSIAKIEGRVLDRIILPNGRLLSPDRLFFVIEKKAKWIRQYQLNQSTRERVKVNLVARREPSPSELLNLRKALQDVVGEGIRVETRLVASIPVGPGGKLRLSHSSILDEYLSG
jgi:phenylacetate-CoA ligase